VQLSDGSQGPTLGRQTAVEKTSAGQTAFDPVQDSGISQTPAEGRQTWLEGAKESEGQTALDPVQVSATSQTPADSRQTVEEDLNEIDSVDSNLDSLNSVLDFIEQRTDNIKAQLLELLNSSREIRHSIIEENGGRKMEENNGKKDEMDMS